jgi:hypothetical protein
MIGFTFHSDDTQSSRLRSGHDNPVYHFREFLAAASTWSMRIFAKSGSSRRKLQSAEPGLIFAKETSD